MISVPVTAAVRRCWKCWEGFNCSRLHTPHYTKDVPFEVPQGWVWCKLENIALIGTGATPSTSNKEYYNNGKIAWVNSSATSKPFINTASNYITEKAIAETNCVIYPKGTLVIAMYGEGKTRGQISELAIEAAINQACAAILPYYSDIKSYIKIFFESNYLHLRTLAEGGNQPNLNLGKISSYYIPIPPIKEQQRIISEVDKWFTLINIIETGKTDLQIVIQQAKSKILDLAIHGKLVPQDPDDEPASELLKRINPEAEITCDNAHSRKLPVNWTSCKLSDLCIFLSRGKSPEYSDVRKYPVFAQKCNLKEGRISIEKARFLAPATLNKWPDIYQLREDDILINSTGTGTVGRVGLFKLSYLGSFPLIVPDSHVSVVRTFKEINSRYIYLLLKTQACQTYFEDNLAGSTNQKELYISVIANTEISLPPVEEQKRIVAKVEELFNYLDHIETALKIQSPFCHTEHREVSPVNYK